MTILNPLQNSQWQVFRPHAKFMVERHSIENHTTMVNVFFLLLTLEACHWLCGLETGGAATTTTKKRMDGVVICLKKKLINCK